MNYLIAHHLGMGDHIILNGLVNHIYERENKKGKKVFLLCYEHNLRNVKRMYDNKDIQFVTVKENTEIKQALINFNGEVEDLHLWTEHKAKYSDVGDEAFFINFDYPVELLTSFNIRRDLIKEKKALNKLTSGEKNYIFIHDDKERGFPIDENRLPKGYKIVRADKETPLFDLLLLFENAKEKHVISSSFLCICLAMKMKNTFAHLYIRNQYLKNYLEKYNINCLM